MDLALADPKGLIRESYRIEGITAPECRSIFLDWALSLAVGVDAQAAMRAVLAAYGTGMEVHPMTVVLCEGLAAAAGPRGRRGGWAGRARR
ncbi:MAG: hypothetical protein K0B00_03280 [Rhodobacteraceae bacterium]|nr:hypothetical protein [Paracoccaceae bacterium]